MVASFFGVFLVVGLIGEYRLPIWHHRIEIFEMLVLIGCGGELISDAGIFTFSEHLQTIQQTRVAELSTLAGEASAKAKKALTDSGTALSQAKEAGTKSGNAVDTANEANVASGNAQKRVAVVEKEADLVEYVLSARHIEDEKGIENDLRRDFKGSHIVFASYWDEESMWLCGQLAKIADKAEVGPINKCGEEPLIPGRPPIEDLYLEGPDHEQLERLSRILKASPKRVPGIFVGTREQPALKVLVGLQRKIWLEHKLRQQAKSKTAKQ